MRYTICLASVLLLCVCVAGCAGPKDERLAQQGYEAMSAGNNAEAAKHYEEALKVNPENPYALLNLGVVYQRMGKKAEAKATYEKLIKLDPDTTAEVGEKAGTDGVKLTDLARKNLKDMEAAK